ncbi:uncharacterized protein METZ01_LOCUS142791, partial [marine metagenome]
VMTVNINAVTELDVSSKEISDLTGIEDFTALESLNCENNQLTALDVSNNPALSYLNCYINQLTALDVSANTALTTLSPGHNQLTTLDVSNNTALTALQCNNNLLTSLDVSANTELTFLYCYSNQLTSLDLRNNPELLDMKCQYNDLSSLNLKGRHPSEYETIEAFENWSLECVDVLDPEWAFYNWEEYFDRDVQFEFICGSEGRSQWHVSVNGSNNTGDGSQENPLETIQLAIDVSSSGDSVFVSSGSYFENISIHKGITVIGEDRETTIIDGDGSGTVVIFDSGSSGPAYFSGFTLTNGSGLMDDDPGNNWDNDLSKGGGIYVDECSPILEDLIIENNTVSGGGGGISKSSENSSIYIASSIIRNNTANYAGAVHGLNGYNEIIDCQVYDNHATDIGGGFGGVMTVSNSFIYNNSAVDGAAAMSADASMFNCTVAGNVGPNYCIEIGGGNTEISNTLIWGNSSPGIQCWSAISITYSDIEGGQEAFLGGGTDPSWGEGNMNEDPLFCDPEGGDYSVSAFSPLIGAASDGGTIGDLEVDCGFEPVITEVTDVPNDQGGWVYLGFSRCGFDQEDITNQLYTIYRYDTVDDSSASEFNFTWDGVNNAMNVESSGLHFGPDNAYIPGAGYDGSFLIMSAFDNSGSSVQSTVIGSINTGDVIQISNMSSSKTVTFSTSNVPIGLGDDRIMIQIDPSSISYVASLDEGFLDDESVVMTNTSASSAWVGLLSIGAIGEEHYYVEVHTNGDSTAEDSGMGTYKVVASMNEGIYYSDEMSGYSVDNIAPGVPTGMQAMAMENSIILNWDMSEAEDFEMFVLERSNEATAGVEEATISYELTDITFEDVDLVRNVEYSYRLAAYD